MGTITFQTITPIDLEEASQEKKVLVQQIADSAASPRPFHREMRFLREMPKDLYHLYQMNKLNCISEGYTGTGHLSICTRPVPTCTTYTRGKASSKLAETAICKVKGDLRSQNLLFLAGLRGQMLGSVKATETGIAEVTVSMTSGNSTGYVNLSSPELGSAKYRQRRSTKPEVTVTSRNAINALAPASLGVCPDNLLNRKAESEFVQASGKEKGPAVSQALLSTSMISCTGESNELHHNSRLQATGFAQYQSLSQPLGSMPLFFISRRMMRLSHAEIDSSPSCSMACRIAFSSHGSTRKATCLFPRGKLVFDICCTLGLSYRCLTMYSTFKTFVKQRSPAVLPTLTGPLTTNDNASIEVAMCNYTALIGRDKPSFTQTRPEFIDTYWIIPEYETTPYGKVSFTRQDRRTFIAMFKDSRLIWAGRQPVKYLTENVKRTESPKLSVEGIEEISIPQGMVKIPPPSTIEEISTVPATVSDITTVQGVAHA